MFWFGFLVVCLVVCLFLFVWGFLFVVTFFCLVAFGILFVIHRRKSGITLEMMCLKAGGSAEGSGQAWLDELRSVE